MIFAADHIADRAASLTNSGVAVSLYRYPHRHGPYPRYVDVTYFIFFDLCHSVLPVLNARLSDSWIPAAGCKPSHSFVVPCLHAKILGDESPAMASALSARVQGQQPLPGPVSWENRIPARRGGPECSVPAGSQAPAGKSGISLARSWIIWAPMIMCPRSCPSSV